MIEFYSRFEDYQANLNGVRLPEFSLPESSKKLKNLSNFEFLISLCKKTFEEKKLSAEYAERLDYELSVIDELGFTDYILLVWDVINYCRQNKIPTGAGRGSCAGSLILYLIGVTRIDPIKYNLYFERFISKTRAKKKVVDGITYLDGSLMVDVDIDICYYNRGKVLKALEEKFKGRTCKILTLNSLQGKLLLKECCKIIGNYSEEEAKSVANTIPEIFGKVKDIESVCEEDKIFKQWTENNKKIYDTALKLRGLIKNKSVHASAMMLSYSPLEESCPVELSSNKDIVSSYDMNFASLINVKLDLLGLRSVSVIDDVCNNIGIKIEDINLDDPSLYRALYDLKNPHGLFQIEADTVFKSIKKIKPKNLHELSGVLAVARPGASQFIDQYALYTNTGTEQSIDPLLDKILGETGGLVLYQESLMKIGSEIFGLDLDTCELLRRACGKKSKIEMEKLKPLIYEKASKNNIPKQTADIYWDILIDSADYSFNKCVFENETVIKESGERVALKDIKIGDRVKAYDVENDLNHYVEVLDVMSNERELYEVVLEDGKTLRISLEHKLLCEDKKMRPLKEIIENGYFILTD